MGRKINGYVGNSYGVKTSTRRNAVYVPIEVIARTAEKKNNANLSIKRPKKRFYVLEIDAAKKDTLPHFHVWRASENRFRISDTRSIGVKILSDSNELSFSQKEELDKRNLSSTEKIEINEFLNDSDNRMAIYILYFVMKHNKKLPKMLSSLSEYSTYVDMLTDTEVSMIMHEFEKYDQKQSEVVALNNQSALKAKQ